MTDLPAEKRDVWADLAASLNPNDLAWRQDGKPKARDGKYFARFVVYVEAGTVRDRLDSVVPGEWDLTLEALPQVDVIGQGGEVTAREFSFKARLQILGVIREDVGTGKDYKQASTDAFKRAAVRFGIGHELYNFEQNWVEVDGDGKYAKPLEDPQKAYERRHGGVKQGAAQAPDNPAPGVAAGSASASLEITSCPKCGGRMWDNRLTKRNPKAPDYKCQNRSCDGVIWPPKEEKQPVAAGRARESDDEYPDALRDSVDDLPF
jgi:hypothetical protein